MTDTDYSSESESDYSSDDGQYGGAKGDGFIKRSAKAIGNFTGIQKKSDPSSEEIAKQAAAKAKTKGDDEDFQDASYAYNQTKLTGTIPGFSITDENLLDGKTSTSTIEQLINDLNAYSQEPNVNKEYLKSVQAFTGQSDTSYNKIFADIDINLKKALVESVIGETDGYINRDMNKIYSEGINNINNLIYNIKPKLELLKMLMEQQKKIKIMKNDPDMQTCVYKLNSTMEYIMREMNPELIQLLNLLENQKDDKGNKAVNEFNVPLKGLSGRRRSAKVPANLSKIQLGNMHIGGGRKKNNRPIGF